MWTRVENSVSQTGVDIRN